MNVLTKIVL